MEKSSKAGANPKKRKIDEISSGSEEEVKQPAAKRLKLEAVDNNKMKRIIVWLRNDLRLHDNYCLDWAVKLKAARKEVLPVFSFDPRFTTNRAEKYGT